MITINDLSFSYTGKPPYIIKDLNLNIEKGSYVSILGENGSSKTTLIKLILGVLKPVNGNIVIATDKIGYVPQKLEDFNSQFPLTVSELLRIHMKAKKINHKGIIDSSLNMVNMAAYKNKLIGELSGGQQQKIFITRALMGAPELLILDEPSTGVDISSQKEIYSIIKDLNVKKSITVISVEHNLTAALKYSTHIFKLGEHSGPVTTEAYINELNNNPIINREVE